MAGDVILIDTKEVDLLVLSITKATVTMIPNVRKAAAVNAMKVKRDARKSVRSTYGHIPHLQFAINYDVHDRLYGIEYEVGYDRDKAQGNIAHIIEFGGSTGYAAPNAPQRNLAKALALNYDDLISGLRKAVLDGFN